MERGSTMNEVKSKNEFRERDEIDEYFRDAKKRSFPTGIIFIILLLALCGGVAYYYFVIDSPKNIFLTAVNSIKTKANTYKQINYDFSLNPNITTNNKEYIDAVDIINNFYVTGKGGTDLSKEHNFIRINTFYRQKDLLSIDTYSEDRETYYIKYNNDIFDKIIKVNINDFEETENSNKTSTDQKENFDNISKTLQNITIKKLKEANYTKEYVDLNNTKVKQMTLIIDKKFVEDYCKELINDDSFMESLSQLEGITESELEENINKEISSIEDDYVEKLSLYLSIFENEFIMLELISSEERFTLNKEDDKYEYKYYNNSIIKYQGYISIEKDNNDYEITFSLDDIEENITIELDLELSLEYDKLIETIDTTGAVDYSKLSENDMNKMSENMLKNEAFKKLLEDIISVSMTSASLQEPIQTT